MIDATYTIMCEHEVVARNVPEYYVCIIVQSIMTRFNKSAAAGDLKITIEAENHTMSLDDDYRSKGE